MTAIDGAELDALVDYWRCAELPHGGADLPAGQPAAARAAAAEHIKPRLLGHWGTSPGLSLVYVQLNRLIRQTGADVIYVAGPGHGGPAIVANTYLEGTYSELFPEVTPDEPGLRAPRAPVLDAGRHPEPRERARHRARSTRAASSATRSCTRSAPPSTTPTCWSPASSETARPRRDRSPGRGRASASCNPARDGAVLPILHLNGYKIASATVLGRRSDEEVAGLLRAEGYEPQIVAGDDPHEVHRRFAEVLDGCYARIREIQADARATALPSSSARRRGPRSCCARPKGWTGPDVVDGVQVQGTFRAHQVPLSHVRENPEHLALLETWLRSYAPERHFDERGRLVPELAALAPEGDQRMGSSPYANGGRLMRPLDLPSIDDYAIERRGARGRSWPSRRAGSARCCATSTAGTRRASGSTARTRRPRTGCRTCSTPRTAASSRRSSRPTTTCRRTAASWRC